MTEESVEELKMEGPPAIFCYRFNGEMDELVINHGGKTYIFPVTETQLKLASFQTTLRVTRMKQRKKAGLRSGR